MLQLSEVSKYQNKNILGMSAYTQDEILTDVLSKDEIQEFTKDIKKPDSELKSLDKLYLKSLYM